MTVENEGNDRMSVAIPPIHLVTAGIEKLVPTFADAMKQVRLLGRSATGQPFTVYTNFITGPRPGQAQHIVLLDNGRTAMAEDPDVAAALRCIRCGACANVCPPYGVVGGHAFGHVYTGAIGLVNTLYHHGPEAAAGPQSLCVSCNACATVCPVEIPLPTQILEVRGQGHRGRPRRRARRPGHQAGHRRVPAALAGRRRHARRRCRARPRCVATASPGCRRHCSVPAGSTRGSVGGRRRRSRCGRPATR